MTKPRRRQAGEGGISEYETKAGKRYLIKYTATDEQGEKRVILRRGFLTRKAAAEELREQRTHLANGTHVSESGVTVAEHFDQWLDGLRLSPSTIASYRKNVRLHVQPYLGKLRLEQLTGTRLTALYRQLEREGRADGTGGLAARTVRYVHTIIHAGLRAAVRDGRLSFNPADKATPPSAREAQSPEMHTWTGEELAAFLTWARGQDDDLYIAWLVLAMTGMRRGEALALRWKDVDFEQGNVVVRRSATVVKRKGEGEQIVVGPPKSGKLRVIDVDPDTVAALRSYRARVGSLSLLLANPDALVLGTMNGTMRHPERFSRTFQLRIAAAQSAIEDLSPIRLHDLRHTHATVLLRAGVHPKVVSERLGHAKVSITLDVYSHVMPTLQREAADRFAAAIYGGSAS